MKETNSYTRNKPQAILYNGQVFRELMGGGALLQSSIQRVNYQKGHEKTETLIWTEIGFFKKNILYENTTSTSGPTTLFILSTIYSIEKECWLLRRFFIHHKREKGYFKVLCWESLFCLNNPCLPMQTLPLSCSRLFLAHSGPSLFIYSPQLCSYLYRGMPLLPFCRNSQCNLHKKEVTKIHVVKKTPNTKYQ